MVSARCSRALKGNCQECKRTCEELSFFSYMIDLLENEKFAAPEIVQALQGKLYTILICSINVHDQYSILFYILTIRMLMFYFKMSNTFSPDTSSNKSWWSALGIWSVSIINFKEVLLPKYCKQKKVIKKGWEMQITRVGIDYWFLRWLIGIPFFF